ncbi:NAD(P)-binding protein [Thelephora ganbajun]|uniref:NAD(P)-binding protein n=1 Tax=Thelephora ganbajun TaxID=370292 RepID=A0ACB6ZUX5_THEGA|nr:NAD(P)-binding protein [Thelephora ganbajun]
MSLFNTSRLLNKTVLITGASSGIGAATAILFAKGGANLVLLARRADALKKVADACVDAHNGSGIQGGGKVATVQIDVSDKVQVSDVLSKIPDELKSIDVLVNNAGYVLGTDRVGQISSNDMEGMFNTNVFGLINMTQAFINEMKARNIGHVINIGSVAGREPYIGGSIYCATKNAVRAFTGALLRELVETQVRVTEIQPGMVETEFSIVRYRGDKDAADKVYQGFAPLTPDDVAEEIVWAASRPPHVNIVEVFIMPTNQATPWLVHRGGK